MAAAAGGFYMVNREDESKIEDYISLAIFHYLSNRVVFIDGKKAKAGKKEIAINKGQFLSSADKIVEFLKKINLKTTKSTVQRRLHQLEEIGIISQEFITEGKRIAGVIYTVKSLVESSQHLEQQAFEHFDESSKDKEQEMKDLKREPSRTLEPQGLQRSSESSNVNFESSSESSSESSPYLEPQRLQLVSDSTSESSPESPIINNKVLSNKVLKKRSKQAEAEGARTRINQNLSQVNTFKTIYNYFEQNISKRITEKQKQWLEEFLDSGMEVELLKQIMDRAGESAHTSAPKYFIDTCRDLLSSGIVTIDSWRQHQEERAAKQKPKQQQQQKGDSDLYKANGDFKIEYEPSWTIEDLGF
jgi:predicted transcriptional regulator